jgi:chromosome segregation ATPase
MEKRIQEVEELVTTLRRDFGELQRQMFDGAVDRKELKASVNDLEVQVARLARMVNLVHQLAVSTSDGQEFLVKKLDELTIQFTRMEEELTDVKRTVFEHTILLKNLRRDVEQIKVDVAELKSDVAQIKTDVADLKTGQTQILEAIRNLQR